MAPSWSSRLLAGSSKRTNSNDNNARNGTSRDKAVPVVPSPPAPIIESTIPRPRTAGAATPTHNHTRSASQPIPKLFTRKKSAGNLRQDTSQPYDETPFSGLDGSPLDRVPSGSSRLVGKRKGSDNVDTKVQRRCICCDSRIKVPKELDKFRCMSCLTINDLKPLAKHDEQSRDADAHTGRPAHMPPPLTVERTRAVMERCLMIYLESRSRRLQSRGPHPNMTPRPGTRSGLENSAVDSPSLPAREQRILENHAPIHASPPVTPSKSLDIHLLQIGRAHV